MYDPVRDILRASLTVDGEAHLFQDVGTSCPTGATEIPRLHQIQAALRTRSFNVPLTYAAQNRTDFRGLPDLMVYRIPHTNDNNRDADHIQEVRLIVEVKRNGEYTWFQGAETSPTQADECGQLLFYAWFSMLYSNQQVAIVAKW